jgi:hypothetical protein
MPHNKIDYSKVIMYKIVCNDLNIKDCYIGHTTDFITRKSGHKNNCNNEKRRDYNIKVYNIIRDNGGWNNWSMIKIEDYPCNSKLDALKRERELIEELKANLNCVIPLRTYKEYYEDTLIYQKERHKIYRENNKDKIKNNLKFYNEDNKDKLREKFNCDCGGHYTYSGISTHLKTKKHKLFLENTKE